MSQSTLRHLHTFTSNASGQAMNIGSAIRARRLALGLPAFEVSKRAGLAQDVVASIERIPSKSARVSTIARIAAALGCTAADLIREAEESDAKEST